MGWGVMIDGKRGYVNKAHIQEQRVYRKDLEFTIPTEFSEPAPTEEKGEEKIKEEEIVPYESEIQKTEQLEDSQLETKEPQLKPSVELPCLHCQPPSSPRSGCSRCCPERSARQDGSPSRTARTHGRPRQGGAAAGRDHRHPEVLGLSKNCYNSTSRIKTL